MTKKEFVDGFPKLSFMIDRATGSRCVSGPPEVAHLIRWLHKNPGALDACWRIIAATPMNEGQPVEESAGWDDGSQWKELDW